MSAISRMPALMACTSSPIPGTSTTTVTCARPAISISSCPTPTVSITTKSLPAASSRRAKSPVLRPVATEGTGVAELRAAIHEGRERHPRESGARRTGAACKIDHLGIAVESLERALAFYEGLLGMKVSGRETVEAEQVRVAMLPVGGGRLELLEPTAPDSAVGRFLAKRGGGLHHVALQVPDLEAAVERLRAAGARLLNEPRAGAGGHIYVFVHPASTGGVLLELIQENQS